jgi:hypothetical protein
VNVVDDGGGDDDDDDNDDANNNIFTVYCNHRYLQHDVPL